MSFNKKEQAHKEFKKKRQTFACSIMYLNDMCKFIYLLCHFCRQFLFLL